MKISDEAKRLVEDALIDIQQERKSVAVGAFVRYRHQTAMTGGKPTVFLTSSRACGGESHTSLSYQLKHQATDEQGNPTIETFQPESIFGGIGKSGLLAAAPMRGIDVGSTPKPGMKPNPSVMFKDPHGDTRRFVQPLVVSERELSEHGTLYTMGKDGKWLEGCLVPVSSDPSFTICNFPDELPLGIPIVDKNGAAVAIVIECIKVGSGKVCTAVTIKQGMPEHEKLKFNMPSYSVQMSGNNKTLQAMRG